jgi:hypothetical protein
MKGNALRLAFDRITRSAAISGFTIYGTKPSVAFLLGLYNAGGRLD